MERAPSIAKILRGASVLCLASLAPLMLAAAATWWHHRQFACKPPADAPDAPDASLLVSCDDMTWYFGPSLAEWAGLVLLYLVLCVLVALGWAALVRRRAAPG